jgi:hypothetical protein
MVLKPKWVVLLFCSVMQLACRQINAASVKDNGAVANLSVGFSRV